jgi:SpoVK/Ycf46/Vps4 family AAA+-type ATPase
MTKSEFDKRFKIGDRMEIIEVLNNLINPKLGVGDVLELLKKSVGGDTDLMRVDVYRDGVKLYDGFSYNKDQYELILEGTSGFDTKIPRENIEKAFGPLIIGSKEKEEIISVLLQHNSVNKLFEEWGLAKTISYGRGMTFLFYGPPGTGKTFCAHCIANAIGKDLLEIGPAEIQSQEPGGANRAINNAFKAAKNKVLFIDECDSLIWNRGTIGMILGSEVNTLLTAIEKHEGVVVLSTNRAENLDEALERRISLIVEFPHPDYDARLKIWEMMIPDELPLGKDVTKEKLAEFNLSGGLIKNALLAAARLAASDESAKSVDMKHFTQGIERINKSRSLIGAESRYHTKKVRN